MNTNDNDTANQAALLAEIQALRQANEVLRVKASKGNELTFKVSAKGAVSVYGMGKWPVTLYGEQWSRLLARADDIRAFCDANRSALAVKGQKVEGPAADHPECGIAFDENGEPIGVK